MSEQPECPICALSAELEALRKAGGVSYEQVCSQRDEARRWLLQVAMALNLPLAAVVEGESVEEGWRRNADHVLALVQNKTYTA